MAEPKADVGSSSSDVSRADAFSELKDEETLSLEQQLELVERELIDKDNKAGEQGPDGKSVDSEESDETDESKADGGVPDEFKSAVKEEVSLQVRLAQLEAENAALRQQASSEDEDDYEDDFDYDVGDLDESLEAMRDPLERMGKFHIAETRKLEKRLNGIMERMEARERELDAEHVKSTLKITDAEEDAIVSWANKNGMRYHDRKSLSNVVRMYRNEQELKELKATQTRRTKAQANPRTASAKSQSSLAEDPERGTGPGGRRTFDDAFDKAVQNVNSKLARGERF